MEESVPPKLNRCTPPTAGFAAGAPDGDPETRPFQG
jgi:hypothetical protein